jgi:hypothetical protein
MVVMAVMMVMTRDENQDIFLLTKHPDSEDRRKFRFDAGTNKLTNFGRRGNVETSPSVLQVSSGSSQTMSSLSIPSPTHRASRIA